MRFHGHMECADWATHADGWCLLGVRFLDMALVCDSMSDGFGRLPVRFHGLLACADWAMHADGWCLGVRFLDKAFVCDSMSDGFGGLPSIFGWHSSVTPCLMALAGCLCASMVTWRAMTGRCMWPAGAMSFNFWTALVCDGFGGLPVRVASTATWSAMIGRCMRPACALSSGDLEGMMVKFDACG